MDTQTDKQLSDKAARIVHSRFGEAVTHLWLSHDLHEISDQEFLTQKEKLFQRAVQSTVLEELAGAKVEAVNAQ